ncbi:MAG: hypothetical protein QF752_09195 [Planctomycetota bacterium]|nr:hypothetical protein [Planctomycetota bacterium]
MKRSSWILITLTAGTLALLLSLRQEGGETNEPISRKVTRASQPITPGSPSSPRSSSQPFSLPKQRSPKTRALSSHPTPEELEQSFRQSPLKTPPQKRRTISSASPSSSSDTSRDEQKSTPNRPPRSQQIDPRTQTERKKRWVSRRKRRNALRLRILTETFHLDASEQTQVSQIFDRTLQATQKLFDRIDPQNPEAESISLGLEEIRQKQRAELQEILGSTRYLQFDQWEREGRFVLEEERRKPPR